MMKRVAGWEARLHDVIEHHRKLPSKFGVSDCYLICDDAVEAVTGERLYPGVYYTSEMGAAKELLARGFKDVGEAFASKLERVAPSLAHRGDIGVIESDGQICGGFFCSLGFAARTNDALIFVPISRVKQAFKVGR